MSEDASCRICLGGCESEPLLEACRCRGTIGWVHGSCLDTWVNETSSPQCELCRTTYPAPVNLKWWKFWNDPIFKCTATHRRQFALTMLINTFSNLISTSNVKFHQLVTSIFIYFASLIVVASIFIVTRNLLKLKIQKSSYRALRSNSIITVTNEDNRIQLNNFQLETAY